MNWITLIILITSNNKITIKLPWISLTITLKCKFENLKTNFDHKLYSYYN